MENKPLALKPPIADPTDATGYSALETVPGAVGAAYPYARFDITVQKFEYTDSALDAAPPAAGGRYLIATLLMKCETSANAFLRWDGIRPTLKSTDGEALRYKNMLLATANRPVGNDLKLGEFVTVRIYFDVPKDVTPKTLALKEGTSRTYEFAVP